MSRKLLWAGPWNETSAIAKFGDDLIPELVAMGFEVDILRTEVGDALALPPLPAAPGEVHQPDALLPHEVAERYDAVLLNLGNHYPFHGGGMPLLSKCAPLVVLHDAWMGDFMWAWRQAAGADAWRVDGLVKDMGADPTGLAALCGSASGAIVHGPHYRDQVEAACAGPVACIPLAFSFPPVKPPRLDGGRLVVATIGHVNPNKRTGEVIRAIGMSPRLRHAVTYILMGSVPEPERIRLTELARRWGIAPPQITGWLPEPELLAMMEQADVFCCLRDPCFEGGSGSLAASLLAARPTLVSDQAHYAALPEGVVLKCAPGREAADVAQHLEWVLENPEQARALGQAAREFAVARHSPRAYAEKLAPVLEESVAAAPVVRAASRLGRRLAALGVPPGDPVVDRAAANLDGLLGVPSLSELS